MLQSATMAVLNEMEVEKLVHCQETRKRDSVLSRSPSRE